MISRLIDIKVIDNFKLWLHYSDNTSGIVDMSYLLKLNIFKPLENTSFFKKVYIHPETNAVAWSDDLDICPDNLYLKLKGLSFEEWQKTQSTYAAN